MTAATLAATSAPTTRRSKPIHHVRAVVAMAMIGAWAATAATGVLLWLAADGQRAGQQLLLFAISKHDWVDLHALVALVAVALTLGHVAIMRRGLVAYARLLLTGRRSATPSTRQPRPIVHVRAIAVVSMAILVPLVVATGIVPWLAADGPQSGQRLLLLATTKHDWGDIHTAVSMLAIGLAVTHLSVVRSGLAADVRLLTTGQRGKPRGMAPTGAR
jgi:hypothetical protein